MVTVLDTLATAARRAIRKRRTGPTRKCCASRTGSASGRRCRAAMQETREIVKSHNLVTVCEEAGCPNIGECWDKKHATFMIMGEICTRACAFCNVATGMPGRARSDEPENVGKAVAKMGLSHVVITSVDRDDLDDGGAEHFADVIRAIRAVNAGHDDRDPDAGFPAQGRRAGDRRGGQARRVQPQSRDRAVELSDGAAGRALLPLDPAAAAGQGTRPVDVHQVRHHGRPRRGAERGAPADGRSAHAPTSISSPSASICSRRRSTIR